MPGESHGGKSLVGYSPWGPEESDTTELFHFHFFGSLELHILNAGLFHSQVCKVLSVGERAEEFRMGRMEKGGLADHVDEEVRFYSKCNRKVRKVVGVVAMGLKIIPFGRVLFKKRT